MQRRDFLKNIGFGLVSISVGLQTVFANKNSAKPNILLFTADDMNWDSVGAFGCPVPDTTPNIDKFAAEGKQFERAHVTVAVCAPCRAVLMSGLYPHHSGADGFGPIKKEVVTLTELLFKNGYINGIIDKVGHLNPSEKYFWSMIHDAPETGWGRNPEKFRKFTIEFFEMVKKEKKPFFLMVNSRDPHRAFAGSREEAANIEYRRWGYGPELIGDIAAPSKTFQPEEIEVPGFLPDTGYIREEVAQYYSSVRRCDDTFGAIMEALDDSGFKEDTLVIFLSDHGMPFPTAKFNCYLQSTKTPWIMSWPGRIKPGTVEKDHFISGIDFMPTILEIAGLPIPKNVNGRSFLPLLEDKSQKDRNQVVTVYHRNFIDEKFEMRCLQDKKYGYIYNAWSDGRTKFQDEMEKGIALKAIIKAVANDEWDIDWLHHFMYRTPEELYDFTKDLDGMNNLAAIPEYEIILHKLRSDLFKWMQEENDPLLSSYKKFTKL